MLNYSNKGNKVYNSKTKNIGWILCQYKRATDGKEITEVQTITGRTAHWLTSSTET